MWAWILPSFSGCTFPQDLGPWEELVCKAAPAGLPPPSFSPSFGKIQKSRSLEGSRPWISMIPHPPAWIISCLKTEIKRSPSCPPTQGDPQSLCPGRQVPASLSHPSLGPREGGGRSSRASLNPTTGIRNETSPRERGKNSCCSVSATGARRWSSQGFYRGQAANTPL